MKSQLIFKHYQQALAQDQLIGLHCQSCHTITTPPQAVCRSCGGRELSTQQLEKTGTLKTFTVIRVAAQGWTPPFIVALVETDDKAWVMGNLEGVDPDKADMKLIGQRVRIGSRVVKADDYAYGDIQSLVFNKI